MGSDQWCYPHTGDALDLHCLAKLNVARKHDKKYPRFKDLKKPLTEMEKEELEIIKEAASKKGRYYVGYYSPFVINGKVFDDAGEQENLIKQAKGEPLPKRIDKETWNHTWQEAYKGNLKPGIEIGLFADEEKDDQ